MTTQATSRRLAGLLGLGFLLVGGCSPPVADVSGAVTVGGKPVPSGKVAFICDGGNKPVLTVDVKDGRYAVTGVPAGKVTITVAGGSYRFDPVPGMPKDLMKASPGGEGPGALPAVTKGAAVEVPKRYGDANQSGLTLTVDRSGPIEHNLELSP